MRHTKLIVLRGPSGSGKSTVAKKLIEVAKKPIVLLEQDHYRFIFKPPGGGKPPNLNTIQKIIKNDTLIALNDGYDVILEGILSVKAYSEVLDEIFQQHPKHNYMFYFDISLDETLRRHNTKNISASLFGEHELREWYPTAHRSNHELEEIIPESFTLSDAVQFIKMKSEF